MQRADGGRARLVERLEWHADLRTLEGPLAGVCIHVKLFFPKDYPLNAPKFEFPVRQLPSFRHPNLYGPGVAPEAGIRIAVQASLISAHIELEACTVGRKPRKVLPMLLLPNSHL